MEKLSRGDLIKIRSAGAYGQVMVSNYNLREFPKVRYVNNGAFNKSPINQIVLMN